MADLAQLPISAQIACIATMPAEWLLRDILAWKKAHPIANVHADLKRTSSALCGHPTRSRDVSGKSSAVAFSRLGRGLPNCRLYRWIRFTRTEPNCKVCSWESVLHFNIQVLPRPIPMWL